MSRPATRPTEAGLRETVARNIRRAQADSGMTNQELAREVNDVNIRLLQKWRSGAVLQSSLNLVRLAEVLRREVSWFYEDHEDPVAA